jgi:hypothetical protein
MEFASGSEWRLMVGNGDAIHVAGTAPRATARPAHGNEVGRRGELRIESGREWNPGGKQHGYGRSARPRTWKCSWNMREVMAGSAGRDTPIRAEKATVFAKSAPLPLPCHLYTLSLRPSPFTPFRSHTPATSLASLPYVLMFPLRQRPIRNITGVGSFSRPSHTPEPPQPLGPPHTPGG